MRLVLGDSHRLFIDSLAPVLAGNGFTVVAVATTPQEVFSALASGFRRHAPGGVSLDAKSAFDLEG